MGDELLLTAGVRLPPDAEGVDTYVRRVVAAGVCTLGFEVAPMHDEVPAELVAACDRHGLPLLRLPPATPFVTVGQATYVAIGEAPATVRAQSALAARPDALRAVLAQLGGHTGAWTVPHDARRNELFSTGPRPGRVRHLAVRPVRDGTAARR
ncbi:PucR family transcriptional regulator ligand-binding domain-containing protein [Streptomyces sp. NPDC002276]